METKTLFYPDGVYSNHRIPGMIFTGRGTLIVYNEARKTAGDWASMDIFARRSTDGGKTFSDAVYLARGDEKYKTVNNPVMVEDRNGRLHFFYCRDYSVNGGGVFRRFSDDDGVSWSEPADITPSTLPEFHNAFAAGPGHGTMLSDGRLLFPVWMVPKECGADVKAHGPSVVTTLISDDDGESWSCGELISGDGDIVSPNETAAAELSDGSVLLNIRATCRGLHCRAEAVSADGKTRWRGFAAVPALRDPRCFGSLVGARLEGGRGILFFVNCDDEKERRNVRVRASVDDGRSWSGGVLIDGARGGYADIAVDAAGGFLYVLYEENYGEFMHLAKVCLSEFGI